MKKSILIILICILTMTIASAVCAMGDPVCVKYENGIYHITIDGNRMGKKIKFIAEEKLITNKEAHKMSGSLMTINAGYFDPHNQKTISYVVTDHTTVADPLFNENLLQNPVLRQNLNKIINRTEFRIVDCNGKYHYEIVPHNTSVDFECSIESSAQGGPEILPELKLEDEFFVVKKEGKIVRESASVLEKTARTIIGLKGNEIHVLIITNKNPKTIYEVQEMCKDLGLDRAMAFDGGSSTSLNYKKSIDVVSTADAGGRMLKSFMLIGN